VAPLSEGQEPPGSWPEGSEQLFSVLSKPP